MKKEAIKFTRLSAIGILLILGTIVGFAQNLTVKGTVKDTSGEPVLGATVVVEGKSGMGTAQTSMDSTPFLICLLTPCSRLAMLV